MNGEYEGRDYRVIPGMDPAANWLLDVAVGDYLPDGPQTPIPFMIEVGWGEGGDRNDMLRILLALFGASDQYDAVIARFAGDAPIQVPLVHTLAFFEDLLTSDHPDTKQLRDYRFKRILLSSPFIPPEPDDA